MAVTVGAVIAASFAWAHVPVPPCCSDFMTGGGWIPVAGDNCNNKASFGFVGGAKNCELWGNLNWLDHCTGDHIKGKDVKFYCYFSGAQNPCDPCRRIVYTGTINGLPVDIIFDVCDNGEPGVTDTVSIKVFPAGTVTSCEEPDPLLILYSRSGTLGGGGPGGGNIQLHQPPSEEGCQCNGDPTP